MSVHISSRLVVSPAGCGTVSCTGGAVTGIGRITRSTKAGHEFDPAGPAADDPTSGPGCGTVSCTGGAVTGIGRITRSTRAGYEFDSADPAVDDPTSGPGCAPHSFHNALGRAHI